MRDAALIKRLCVAAVGTALMILLAGCSVEAGDEQAAHDLAEKFAKQAGKDNADLAKDDRRQADEAIRQAIEERRKTEDAARQAAEGRRKAEETETRARARGAAEARRKAEEAEMLARARAEAEQRRAEIAKAREAAERAERDRQEEEARKLAEASRKAEEERRIAEARQAEERERAAEEARWLAEARRKAEEEVKAEEARRDAEDAQRRAAEERRIAEARRAEEQARVAEEARRKAEEAAKAEEARRLAEAERRAEEERRIAEARKTEEERHLAEAKRRAEELAKAAEVADNARRAKLEAEREAEAQRLAEKLRQAREQRANRTAAMDRGEQIGSSSLPEQGSTEIADNARTISRLGGPHAPSPQQYAERVDRVTVLLVLEPGNYGIRRHNKTADPILCSQEGCYVSNGADEAASFLSGRRALKFGRIFGDRAGACSNSLGCVFRDIDLRSIAQFLAPVDMHVLKHDRRQPQQNVTVSDCRAEGPHLSCRGGIRTVDYAMWIVPEALAERVGPEALEDALAEGLAEHKRVGLAPSSMR